MRPEDGALIRRWSRSTEDPPGQIQHTEDRFQVIVDGQVVAEEHHQRSPALRWYTVEAVRSLLEGAGFEDVKATGGFTNHPVFSANRAFVVRAKRP